ncbi:response regulator [Paenibacillus sp. URB8-2]|uniref:response regulator n=1 Tax=Paenibacillus sp. URB8-2 TaxID=2741301 RepID=UPI0015BAF6B0|nr:response regulator [Paenibacillus sp. URB8-2]BCG58031.1 DNA-binding response regulator [Paenibacillus sp. URB8-2]
MLTVMLVEDEVFVRESVRKIIDWEALGFTVIGEAGDGEEAFRFIIDRNPDIVISDIIMPRMNGVDLLKKVREHGISSRFIMLSCMSDFEYVRQALEYGASNYILKLSMDVKALRVALEKVGKELNSASGKGALQSEARKPASEPDKSEDLTTDHPEINRILDYIHQHFMEDITLTYMAHYVVMDVKYVSQLFKKKTGQTFVHYLHRIRIEQACRYLETSRMPVHEIGERVGFTNDNYFIKIFRRCCGMTPQSYRKLNTNNRANSIAAE